ncbi:hypothetical protein FACS1894151_07000 [Spirochaetia bacterium]|nr:hypothetical protein FACS1894151_07000 [Spirochaetia bacterium]
MPTALKRKGTERNETPQAIKAAAAVASKEADNTAPAKPMTAEKIVSIRLTDFEYNELKAAYAKEGVKLGTGIKKAALWVLQNRNLLVTRTGIVDRREQ